MTTEMIHETGQPASLRSGPWLGLSKARAISGVAGKEARPASDFYPTPPHATKALLSVESFDGGIWEPACGQGHISEVLKEHGHEVTSTDLFDHGYGKPGIDFTKQFVTGVCANVVTNPPYNMAREFVDAGLLSANKKVAMLLKLSFLEGVTRKDWFQRTPLKCIYVFSRRISLTRLGEPKLNKGMVSYAWFVWEHGHLGEPLIRWIDHCPNAADEQRRGNDSV